MKKSVLICLMLGLILGLSMGWAYGALYKSYEGTISAVKSFSVAYDLGMAQAKGGYFANNRGSSNATLNFCIDGTNWGESITVFPGEVYQFDTFDHYTSVEVTPATSVSYRMVIGRNNKLGVE